MPLAILLAFSDSPYSQNIKQLNPSSELMDEKKEEVKWHTTAPH